jgi:hypothetical protein
MGAYQHGLKHECQEHEHKNKARQVESLFKIRLDLINFTMPPFVKWMEDSKFVSVFIRTHHLTFEKDLNARVQSWLANPSLKGLEELGPYDFGLGSTATLQVEELVRRRSGTIEVEVSLWLPLPLTRRCHSAFIDSLLAHKNEPKLLPVSDDKGPPLEDLEAKLSFVLAPFQREGVLWMAKQEATISSLTHGIFEPLELPPQGSKGLFRSTPNPSETIVWREWPMSRSGGFLADEPGLGKTVQMVTLMNLCGFHYRNTPPWVKGAYGQWMRPLGGPRYRLRRYEVVKHRSKTEVLHSLPTWSSPTYPWFCPDVPLGGTLIVFPTTLSGQWEDELRDKSVNEELNILNLSKPAGVCIEGLLLHDVVLVTHGMLRAERRRSSERVVWGAEWRCTSWKRVEISRDCENENEPPTLESMDLISLLPWGSQVLVDRVDDAGKFYGWPWSNEMDNTQWGDTLAPSTTAEDFSLASLEWHRIGRLEVCGHLNEVGEGEKRSTLACAHCGAPPSPKILERLSAIEPSPLFRIWWRRVILDESDRLTSMPQTLSDATLLNTNVLWCLTGTPNGTDPRFGQNFLHQLDLFFVNGGRALWGGITKDVGLAIQEWRDPAFQGDLVDLWMKRRTKAEVRDQLSLPPVDMHSVEVRLLPQDGKEWIDAMHRDMACIGSTRFGRLWRVLTIQEGLDSVILVDNMDVDLEGPRGHDSCPVCMEKIDKGKCIKTPCGHFFCKPCIQTWMCRAPGMEIPCPSCRFSLTPKNLMLSLEPAVEPSFSPGNLSKLRAIQNLLEKIPKDDRVLIASRYPEAMATLTRILGCPSLHSKMSKTKRDAILRSGWSRALVISMNLHGFGLNLTQANHLILVDEPSKPHHSTQLVGRVYRIGQKKHVHIYRLVTRGTLEEWVDTGTDLAKILVSIFGGAGGSG